MGGLFASCTSETQNNSKAVGAAGIGKGGQDIDDAALQAIKGNIGDAHAAQLKQSLSLTFSLRNLPNLDTLSKTDAFIVLYALQKQGTQTLKKQVGKTECIWDNLNPDFVTQIQVDYFFEETQNFLLQAYDMDDKNQAHNLSAQDYIGEIQFQLHQVVTARDQQIEFKLNNPSRSKNGEVLIQAEEISASAGSESAEIKLTGNFSESGQIFFIIWKQLSPGKYKPVFKSEFKQQERGQQNWNPFIIDTGLLCNQDPNQEVKIDVYRADPSGDNKILGVFYTCMEQLKEKQPLVAQGKKKHTIDIASFEVKRTVNFLEYVFGGCEINLNIAIDFTMSNGPVNDPNSLHSQNPAKNEYLHALRAVGSILQYYDSDKEIPLYGFGAIVSDQIARPSHCFALNGDIFAPECNGIEGVEAAYHNAINKVKLHGPTYFSEILSAINGRCEASEVSNYNQCYQILLIITDGVINDLQKTIDEIVRGADNPLSIVIVGVGDADFSTMDQLDADVNPLYSQKYRKYMSRDIVQFVPYREFQHDQLKLAKETLTEIPGQLTEFFQKRNIQPRPAKEEERKRIQAQLSLRKKVDPQKQLDMHQSILKEKLIGQAQEMGIDTFQVQDIIEEKGIWENNMEIILDMLNKPNLFNPLKMQQMPPPGMQGGQFGGMPQQQMMYQQQQQMQQPYMQQNTMYAQQQQQQQYMHMQSMNPGMAGGYQQQQQPMMGMQQQQQYQTNPQDMQYGFYDPTQQQ